MMAESECMKVSQSADADKDSEDNYTTETMSLAYSKTDGVETVLTEQLCTAPGLFGGAWGEWISNPEN